jgi:hypothetical protein
MLANKSTGVSKNTKQLHTMTKSLTRYTRNLLLLLATTGALVLGVTTNASAHQPVFVTNANNDPKHAPTLLDGTVSFAVYGSIEGSSDARWIKAILRKGDELLLIPNQDPERSFDAESMPNVEVTSPSHKNIVVPPSERKTFDEPYSNTSYVYILSLRTKAEAGTYLFRVQGKVPSRFTLVVGSRETAGKVKGESPPSSNALTKWWNNPVTPSPNSSPTSPPRSSSTKHVK